ncbi:transglutaminase domain-containing protein [Paenibacillus fonticola]|uniref:transglutaminase domain-containing protein n=1 Tax=Paenibacillus fonticola TaxID=379896 RepID=UPI000366FD9C|nr:transglutaminase domain-containing protein [Paenibacillus fonticola]
MRQRAVKRWIVAGIVSAVVFGAIPPGVGYPEVFADSQNTLKTASVSSLQEIQTILAEMMQNRQTTIVFKYQGSTQNIENDMQKAMNAALDDDPYTKYVVDLYNYSYKGTTGSAKITFQINYRESAAQSAYVNERVKEILQEIIKEGMNEHQKVKAIHDYVVLNLKYDEKLQKYTAYEGLKTGTAVCQGYALLTYKLLQQAGMNNQIIEGSAGGQLHAWNLVYINGHWYHLDTTWDDPVPDMAGVVKYTYYMRSDEQMRKTHSWRNVYPPAKQSYRQTLRSLITAGGQHTAGLQDLEKQLEYTLYNPESVMKNAQGIQGQVRQALKEKKNTVTIRYSGTEKQLLDHLATLYELPVSNISYLAEPLEETKDLRVEIHWETK